jgi:hypothetical protein
MSIKVQGTTVIDDTRNFTANTITGQIIARTTVITNASSITINSDTTDFYEVTALAVALTINIPSGTPADGQKLLIKLKDSGSAQTLTCNVAAGGFRVIGTTLPTTTTAGKTIYVGSIYNSTDGYWDVVAVATQA